MRLSLVTLLLAGGCLGEATVISPDLSANPADLALSKPADLRGSEAGGSDGGALYNCVQLNDCEKACAGDPKPQTCVTACRAKATANALSDELALQGCFNQYCPQVTDAGTSAVCTQSDMGFSAACSSCIANSQVAPANACSGTVGPECHQCYTAAEACVNDK